MVGVAPYAVSSHGATPAVAHTEPMLAYNAISVRASVYTAH